MLRRLLFSLTALIIAFSIIPIIVLIIASGLPDGAVVPNGIASFGISAWHGPRIGKLLDTANLPLWKSLMRTIALSSSVAAVASSLSIGTGYIQSRWRSHCVRASTRFLALAAYGLPSVFLLLAIRPMLTHLSLTPIAEVWLLHLVYILPMSMVLALGYAATYPHAFDRSAALDGANWISRFGLAYRMELWRGHLAIACIGVLISWGDIIFSYQILRESSKLVVDLYLLKYFDNDSTIPDYVGASVFGLVICSIALALSFLIAITNRGDR